MYPLSLIHRRKGRWLHVGSNPTFPTKNIKIMKIIWKFQKFLLYLYCSSLKKWRLGGMGRHGGLN